ncbi:MAG: bifunctional DNA-formamidopyrimidine glycosylase/DNA-(apurinic or apyrimidinic site) lyase [Propioniciclava sp.]
MPELPEVETVRAGLAPLVAGRRIETVTVLHPRLVRHQPGGAEEFQHQLVGCVLGVPRRRGKYLWFPLDGEHALLAHLGMSGQFRVDSGRARPPRHLRVTIDLSESDAGDPPLQLRYADQRMFGELKFSPGGVDLPSEIRHIARDLLDPDVDRAALVARIRRSRSGIKRLLLNQRVTSGIGNIYADEALWRARIHYDTSGAKLSTRRVHTLLDAARATMTEALAQGGTSFDDLYVHVNGESGYFSRSLRSYSRDGEPCYRCGAPIVREPFMNRSSYFCPKCQRRPRR